MTMVSTSNLAAASRAACDFGLKVADLVASEISSGVASITRWVALTGKNGKGLLIRANETMGFNALRNSIEDFDSEEAVKHDYQWSNFTEKEIAERNPEKAKNRLRRMHHVNDISPRNFVEVCVDMKQQGVAGYDSWGSRPEKAYSIPANQNYTWGFTLVPVKNNNEAASKATLTYE